MGKKYKWIKLTVIVMILAMLFSTATVFGAKRPAVIAKSGVVMDPDTGDILYSRNMHMKRDPVSTTKLLTTLIAAENLDLDQLVTISKSTADKGGSSMGLVAGEEVTVRDLLYGALLPSGNDAAVALAKATAGSLAEFRVMMNEKAEELGCVDSNFSNPQGWKSDSHYSSAYDMAVIAKAAMANDMIRVVCGTEKYITHPTNKQDSKTLWTTNSFVAGKVYINCGVFAGKTGTWDYYNSALVSACERDGKELYAVVLKDTISSRYRDTNNILNYSYSKL